MRSPNYSSISKRAKTVEIKYRNLSRGAIRHIAIDSTGLKVFGEGEWKVKKYGSEKRQTWRKLHMAVDVNTHEIISAEMTFYSEVLPSLFYPLLRRISEVSADGAYDTKECHKILNKKIKPLISSRKGARL